MNQREQELDKLIIKIWELTGNLTYTSEGVSAFNFYGSSNKVRDAVEAFVNKTSKQDQLELLESHLEELNALRRAVHNKDLEGTLMDFFDIEIMKHARVINKLKEELSA